MKKLPLLFILFFVASCASVEEVSTESESAAQQERESSVENKIKTNSYFIRGVSAFEMGEMDLAVSLLSEAYKLSPNEPGIQYALMDAYLKTGDTSSAVYFGESAVQLSPKNKWYRLRLSEAYRQSGRFEDTISQLHEILEIYPTELDILFLIAGIESRRGRFEQSNQAYQRVINLIGPDRNVYFQMFQNYSSMGDQEKALKQLENIRDIEPGNVPVLQTLSQFYLETNQVEKAMEVLELALEESPNDPELLISLADVYISQGSWNDAGNILMGIVEDVNLGVNAKLEILQYVMSRHFGDMSNQAISELLDAMIAMMLTLHDDNGYVHALIAEHYSELNDFDKALYHLEQTTKLLPDNESAWRQRLQTYYAAGDYDSVISVGKEANDRIPDDAFIQFFIGGAYLLQDDNEQAVYWLQRAVDMPSRRNFRSIIAGTLGDAHAGKDNWEDADEAYEFALRLDPENDVALNNYAYFLSERNERLEYAKEMSRKALNASPNNAAYLDTMGWIYFKLGDYEQAQKYIRASIDTGSASATVLEHMGDVYDKLGDTENAIKYWQKAYEKDDSRDYLRERLPGI